jgi:hypothetical protein
MNPFEKVKLEFNKKVVEMMHGYGFTDDKYLIELSNQCFKIPRHNEFMGKESHLLWDCRKFFRLLKQ